MQFVPKFRVKIPTVDTGNSIFIAVIYICFYEGELNMLVKILISHTFHRSTNTEPITSRFAENVSTTVM